MPPPASRHAILQFVRRIRTTDSEAGTSDAELLRRFVAGRDQAAFELLVWRHGAMVLRVCRSILRDGSAAEDAFQATFLTLARKAAAVARLTAPAGWICRVATRIALRVRRATARRLVRETLAAPRAAVAPPDRLAETTELAALLHEEINRLAPRYRLPLVLCYLEGKTLRDAAAALGWPRGTVAGRLARGRALLKLRLTRRGVALSAAGFVGLLGEAAEAASRAPLAAATARAAAGYVTGATAAVPQSAVAIRLADGEVHAMFLAKVKFIALVVLIAGLLAAASVGLARVSNAADPAVVAIAEDPPAAGVAAEPQPGQPGPEVRGITPAMRARFQSIRNLGQIAVAMHNYHSMYDHFPADFTDAQGKPILSWRVALLPYLGAADLAKRFKFDEPWDGPNNKKLLAEMPNVYRAPTQAPNAVDTFYQAFSGPGAIFERPAPRPRPPAVRPRGAPITAPVRVVDISDGTANTLLAVEAGTPVPWTKPEDIPYDPNKPLPKLGGVFPNVINAAFADASVHTLRKDFSENTLRAAVTRDGGENENRDELFEPITRLRARETAGTAKNSTESNAGDAELVDLENSRLQQLLSNDRVQIAQLLAEVEPMREGVARQGGPKPDPQRVLRRYAALAAAVERQQAELEKLRKEAAALRKSLR